MPLARPHKPAARASPAHKQARRDLHEFHTLTSFNPDGPTPERLAQLGGHYFAEPSYEAAEVIGKDGKVTTQIMTRRRMRLGNTPFTRLKDKRLLHEREFDNLGLYIAGEKYLQAYITAGISSFPAIDLSKPSYRDGLPKTYLNGVHRLQAFELFEAGRDAVLDRADRIIVNEIVLHEIEPVDAGRHHCGYWNTDSATAVCLDRLRRGLRQMAEFWGILAAVAAPADRRVRVAS